MKLSEYVAKKRGRQSLLASRLGVTPVLVHQWAQSKRKVPAERCLAIEEASKGDVTRYELRPDVFGDNDSLDTGTL